MKHFINSTLILLFILYVSLTGFTGCSQKNTREFIYAGTFSSTEGEGIYVFEFYREDLHLELLQTVPDRESPSFQALHPEKPVIYSAGRTPIDEESDHHTIGAYRINLETGTLSIINEQSVMGRGPAHVSVDPLGEFVYISNYSSGNLSIFPLQEDGSLNEASDVIQHEGSSIHPRQQAPHVHATDPSPNGRFIYVSDLGLDKIKIYEVNRQTRTLAPAPSPYYENTPGSGPRHFTFHPNANFAYSVEELSSTIAALRVDQSTGGLEQIQRVTMLPDDFEESNTAADIHISPDGRFLYATNRGHDSMVIFAINESTGKLTFVGHESTIGKHPRNFMIDHKGEYIFVANRDNDHIVIFRRNQSTGELTYTGMEVIVPRVVCLTQFFVN